MGREKYYMGEDEQPPMCGEAVLNKLRPKKKENSRRGAVRSFDQRPIGSAMSSDNSMDDDPVGLSPETALLSQRARSRRSSKKFSVFKNFMNPIFEESPASSGENNNEEVLINEFFMEIPTMENDKPEETAAVEFNPNDLNMIRNKHIRSNKPGKTTASPNPTSTHTIKSSLKPALSEASNHSATKETAGVVEHSKQQDTPAMGGVLSMKDVLAQQQETLRIMSEQNQYYRKKLGDAQASYRKLYKSKMGQADVIEKLQLEKASFEAETLLLREEMQSVRKQLDQFQKAFEQQKTRQEQPRQHNQATTTRGEQRQGSPVPYTTVISPPIEARGFDSVISPKNTTETNESSSSRSWKVEDFEKVTDEDPAWQADLFEKNNDEKTKGEEAEPADPAQNYWKREWELLLKGRDEAGDDQSEGAANEAATDENNDPLVDSSDYTGETASVASARGVSEPKDIEQELRYVNKLSKQPHSLGTPYRDVGNHEPKNPQLGSKFDEGKVMMVAEEEEAWVEIENMFEVDLVYKQRQEDIAHMRKMHEGKDNPETQGSGKHIQDPANVHPQQALHSENRHSHPVQHKGGAPKARNEDHSARSHHSRVRFEKSTKQDNRVALPDAYENELQGGFPAMEKKYRFVMREDNFASESRQDESSYRSERSDYGPVRDQSYRSERSDCGPSRDQSYRSERSAYGPAGRDQSYRSERSDYGPSQDQSYRSERSDYGPGRDQSYRDRSDYGPIREHSTRTERSDYGPIREHSTRTERSDYGPIREHSTRTGRSDYGRPVQEQSTRSERTYQYETRPSEDEADHLDHSTSLHNALLWAHSSRSERTYSYPVKPEVSVRTERTGYTSRSDVEESERSGYTTRSEVSERSGYTTDGMEGIMDNERSEHTLATIHQPGQGGRKGGTYKIKMSSTPHHTQPPTEPPTPASERSLFSRNVDSGHIRQIGCGMVA